MKLITFSEITDTYLADNLLLLNTSALSTYYVARLISRDSTSVATKGGLTLPPELWGNIFSSSPRRGPRDAFVLVEANMTSETETEKVLACQEVKLKVRFGLEVDDSFMLEKCEELLTSRSRVERFSLYDDSFDDESEDELSEFELVEVEQWEPNPWDDELSEDGLPEDGLPEDKIPEDTLPEEKSSVHEKPAKKQLSGVVYMDTTHQIVIRADGSGHPCVFSYLTVPDVIARVEGGRCCLCDKKRFMSPCQTGDTAREFGITMMCGRLVCPLCIGVDVAYMHEDYVEGEDDSLFDLRATKRMDRIIRTRFKKLGYEKPESVGPRHVDELV